MRSGDGFFDGAARLSRMYISPIRTMLDKTKAMEDKGLDVIRFLAGEPDFNTPEDIKEAAVRAIRNNHTRYGSNRGLFRLRQAIAGILAEECGVDYDPETEIIVTTGGAEAINNAFLALLDPGNEVIIPTPAFVSYENMAYMCGAEPVPVPLLLKDGFQLDVREVEKRITPRTRMIVINNPCNPTGAVYARETLEKLSELAIKHDLIVFSDEIYNRLTYNGGFCSMASLPHMRERTVLMNGFSKTYAMTGWRLGYLAADRRMVPALLKIHQYDTTCSPTFVQEGLADALNTPGTRRAVAEMVLEFQKRRDVMAAGLKDIPGLRFASPEGAFYVFVDVRETGLGGDEFAERLLCEKLVATVPGGALGIGCEDFVRLSFATSMENIRRGLKRMQEFVAGL